MRRTILTGLICLTMGAAVGYLAARHSFERIELSASALSGAATIAHDRIVLRYLNEGNLTNARSLLVCHIITETMLLDGALQEWPPEQRDPALVKALERARSFRSNSFREVPSQKKP